MKPTNIVNILIIILLALLTVSCPHRYDYDNFYYGSPPSTIRPDIRTNPMFMNQGQW